ncbi:hypothetical protein [Microvirga sp. Mcv34]|uniref:hypothetical protein n=1 Tax=Microvirga sp. Mcv34 TaxID=2926016 RepID=UPI0021C9F9F9|nr:hypothetical protein [Microvirga sp. Mcv34]
MKTKLFAEAEIAQPADFDDIGAYARQGVDDVVGGAIGYPSHWSGYTVEKVDAATVRVSPGVLFDDEIVYSSDAATVVSLQVHIPAITDNRRWIGLVVQGQEATRSQNRQVETDSETGETVNIAVPKVEDRFVNIILAPGAVELSTDPTKPEIPADNSCIAFVLLGNTGIVEIVPGEAWRAKTLYEVEGRVTALEVSLAGAFVRVATLETDLSNLAAHVNSLVIPRPEIVREMRRDIAAMRRQLQVPEGARSDWYDPALVMDQWDSNHSAWLARIKEGIQFPFASYKEGRLELVNEDNPLVRFSGRRMLPAYSEVKRIFNEGSGETRNISQLTHTVITAIQKSVPRSRISFGPTINICENAAEWSRYAPALHAQSSFQKDGELWVSDGIVANFDFVDHRVFAVRQVKVETYYDYYWEYQPQQIGVNGSVFGQTFNNANPMIATSIELDFSVVAPDGEVHLFVCEVDETGVPLYDSVLATSVLTPAQLKLNWNKFPIPPTYFQPGKRFAWFTVTTGNHQLRGTGNNNFSGGTSFLSTDGAWSQGDLKFDFNFRINAARFANSRSVIDFRPMTLENGMTQFSLLYPNWTPEGTALEWEIRPQGAAEWSKLKPADTLGGNPLVGLPPHVEIRAVILATPDLAPMIELSANAVYQAGRIRNTWRAVSKRIEFGLSTTQVQTVDVLDDFDPAVHTYEPRIMVADGPALISPTTSTTTIDKDKPSRRTILSTFTVPAGTTAARWAGGGSTSNVVNNYFAQNAALFAL